MMAVAPERISIKRRRTDDPIEHLLYQNKKQKNANHIFVRLASTTPQATRNDHPVESRPTDARNGPPAIKTSAPGDEVRDFQRYKAAHGLSTKLIPESSAISSLEETEKAYARQFYLTRDLSIAVRPQSASIGKNKSTLRPHLPTFVERTASPLKQKISPDAEPPIDRILRSSNTTTGRDELDQILSKESSVQRNKILPFAKPKSNILKTGTSIRDDPSTWNLESVQLADELAALALEMDPDAKAISIAARESSAQTAPVDKMQIDAPDEYVYETYIRLQQNIAANLHLEPTSNIGYLVIDESEEDLWNQYLRDEDDDDDSWDEEDEDSNAEDNPRNEYPDEEVSSGDEFGHNPYKYRRGCSDDEQYDEDDF